MEKKALQGTTAAGQLPVAYFIVDVAGDVMEQSGEAIRVFGAVHSIINLVPQKHASRVRQQLRAGTWDQSHEWEVIVKSGETRSFDVQGRRVQGNHALVFTMRTDEVRSLQDTIYQLRMRLAESDLQLIEKAERLENALLQLDASKTQSAGEETFERMAAGMVNEVRNPLVSIRGFVQLLMPQLDAIGRGNYADILLSEIDRANAIMGDFLRSSQDKATLTTTESDIGELLHELLLLTQSEASLRGIQMSMDAASGYLVSVDISQMKQVFLNILHNSFDAIEEKTEYGGKIHISLQQTTDSVTVSIQDDGVGMNDITKQNVFIPFFTTKSEGTGLGLSVCKRIIENHGGYLHLDSTVGHGTRIAVSLPPRR